MILAEWTGRFEFSQSDLRVLRKALAGKPNIGSFIQAAQSIVENGRLSIRQARERPTNEQRSHNAQRIKRDAEHLAARLYALPEWTSHQLDVGLQLAAGALLAPLHRGRRGLKGVPPNVDAAAHLLAEIARAAAKVEEVRPEPRKRQHAQAVQMVRFLEAAYRREFAQAPRISRNSQFAKVVAICLQGANFSAGHGDPLHLMKRAAKM